MELASKLFDDPLETGKEGKNIRSRTHRGNWTPICKR